MDPCELLMLQMLQDSLNDSHKKERETRIITKIFKFKPFQKINITNTKMKLILGNNKVYILRNGRVLQPHYFDTEEDSWRISYKEYKTEYYEYSITVDYYRKHTLDIQLIDNEWILTLKYPNKWTLLN